MPQPDNSRWKVGTYLRDVPPETRCLEACASEMRTYFRMPTEKYRRLLSLSPFAEPHGIR